MARKWADRAVVERRALEAVDVGDVRVVEGRQQLRLALEAGEPLGILREVGGQHLDGDVAAEPGVARSIHLAHAAGAERRDDLVGAEPSADHGRGSCFSLAVQPSTTAIGSCSSTRLRLSRNR